jgi:hypothetical protein
MFNKKKYLQAAIHYTIKFNRQVSDAIFLLPVNILLPKGNAHPVKERQREILMFHTH